VSASSNKKSTVVTKSQPCKALHTTWQQAHVLVGFKVKFSMVGAGCCSANAANREQKDTAGDCGGQKSLMACFCATAGLTPLSLRLHQESGPAAAPQWLHTETEVRKQNSNRQRSW
jgi:hypothetical protein